MSDKSTIITSAHPNEQVAKRRRDLLDSSLEKYRQEHAQQQSSSKASSSSDASSDSDVIKLSSEGLAKLMSVTGLTSDAWYNSSTVPFEARVKLRNLVRSEISSGKIVIPYTNVANRLLRDKLLESFSISSKLPVPALSKPEERNELEMHLIFFTILKAPGSSLPPELQRLKSKIVSEVVKIERDERAERYAEADREKHRINVYLRSHGEPEINFDVIRHYPDPEPNYDNIKFELPEALGDLEQRKPEVSAVMWEMWKVFVDKGTRAEGYFKKA